MKATITISLEQYEKLIDAKDRLNGTGKYFDSWSSPMPCPICKTMSNYVGLGIHFCHKCHKEW